MSPTRSPAVLVLEDGLVVPGTTYGAHGRGLGELVVSTATTGYQEMLTDPASCGQIVLQTAPQIGNTGWNDEDAESDRIWAAGHVVRDPARSVWNWRHQQELEDVLRAQDVVGIAEVDTRMLTRHLARNGVLRAGVFSGDAVGTRADMVAEVRAGSTGQDTDLVDRVTTGRTYSVPARTEPRLHVTVLDLGVRASTLRLLTEHGIQLRVVPAHSAVEDVLDSPPDGVFLSGGPGDPGTQQQVYALVRTVLDRGVPLLGVGLGHQILGRALGLTSHRMHLGHRGHNIPVRDVVTGRVTITSQNHGFALDGQPGEWFDTPFGNAQISRYCVHDGTAEGLRCQDVPAFSMQHAPETRTGESGTPSPLDEFVELMLCSRPSEDRIVE